MFAKKALWGLVFSVFAIVLTAGDLKIASVFSDHMVIQRDKPVPVWGWAKPGTKVTVEFKGQKFTATTDKDGKWLVQFKPLKADSNPAEMLFSASAEKKKLNDILVGEVWLCSGQSNMEWPVCRSVQGAKMIAAAKNPNIRLLKIAKRYSGFPLKEFAAKWQQESPANVRYFSAVGYYFGLELNKALNVPIGLIESAWGGTRIEPWTPPIGFMASPQTKVYLRQIASANNAFQAQLKKCLPNVEPWLEKARRDLKLGKRIEPLEPPYPTHRLSSRSQPTGLFNAMIAPLVTFPIRGAIWYQGEANRRDGLAYFYKMKALINGWRKLWKEGDFPFYFVQIAPYRYGRKGVLPPLWLGQYRAAKEIENCDLVFPGDVGNIRNIHPTRKYPVAKRLAMLALVNDYGKKITGYKSPVFKSLKTDGNKLVISFDNLESDLKTNDGKAPREFMIAEEAGKFFPAKAEIRGKEIILTSDKVKAPAVVHYAWHNLSVPNLISGEGLPVLPFRAGGKENAALNKSYVSSDRNPWGWDGGLTDGSWGHSKNNCFATRNTAKFPKYVTIDLAKEIKLSMVKLGVPPFGSTKTVNIQVSTDGKEFKTVGTIVFKQGKAQKETVKLDAVKAHYLRLEFTDCYSQKVKFDQNFMFITELEAYEKK
jgi:sialate O-acetylesterase